MASQIGDTTPKRGPDPATTSDELSMTSAAPTMPLPPSAASRVAGIPELLEMILSNLLPDDNKSWFLATFPHLRTLLSSQLTNTTFHDTIKGSIKIQSALSKAKTKKEIEKELERASNGLKETLERSVQTAFRSIREDMLARLG